MLNMDTEEKKHFKVFNSTKIILFKYFFKYNGCLRYAITLQRKNIIRTEQKFDLFCTMLVSSSDTGYPRNIWQLQKKG